MQDAGVWFDWCSDVERGLSLKKGLLAQLRSAISDIKEIPQLPPGESGWVQ